jgi:calcium-dependent protein kinase
MICPEEKRITIKEILQHPFIKDNTKREPHIQDLSKNMQSKIDNLREYSESTLLQKIVYTALSQRLSFKEIEDLQEIFMSLDIDDDGVISQEEFIQGLKDLRVNTDNEDIQNIFQMMDTNKSKKINYSEFLTASVNKKFLKTSGKLREVFDYFDKDKSGSISFEEFKEALTIDGIDSRCFSDLRKEFEEADTNKDGIIQFVEFVDHINNCTDRIIQKRKKGW